MPASDYYPGGHLPPIPRPGVRRIVTHAEVGRQFRETFSAALDAVDRRNTVLREARTVLGPTDARAFRRAVEALEAQGYEVTLRRTSPVWQIGDVVVMRFGRNPRPYTYVHDGRHFPGVNVSRTNAEMTAAWLRGEARLLVRAGEAYDDKGPEGAR